MVTKNYGEAETRRLEAGKKVAMAKPGEDIVISGIAGRFPNSNDTAEFLENLMNKVDLCDDDERRWTHNHPEIPKLAGKINNIDKFDVAYFGVHERHANAIDPALRMLLEKAFEAMLDAGLNPADLVGSNTGVFIGTCYSEMEEYQFYNKMQTKNFAMMGCQRSMQAQHLSYAFKLNGPSFVCDTACSSSMYAFEAAYKAIRDGKCDQALVGGTNLCFNPNVTLQFARLGVLNMNTGCRPFDDTANGYTRAEAVAMMILQKSKDAKRVYAQVVHSKVNVDGYKQLGITYPSASVQKVLLEDVYSECNVDPTSLAFVEAHGTGTKVGDPEELKAIDDVFCTGRDKPLLIGSIKGNIGHSEPSSGLCSIIKMIYAMETGFIPPNIHCENPKLSIDAIKSKRLEVVSEPTPWPNYSSLGGVNSFGFGGANGHVIMKRNSKEKKFVYDDLPRLVCFSGRTSESIESYQDSLKNMKLDYDYIGLLQQCFKKEIEGHGYRGYSILTKSGELIRSTKVYNAPTPKVYLSIGNSRNYNSKIVKELQLFNIFKTEFDRINKILKLNNINIDLFSHSTQSTILHQTLRRAAIHICIINVLKVLNITVDFIIGTSLGDFASAYANGVLSMQETLLSTYVVTESIVNSRGNETNLEETILTKLKAIIPNKSCENIKGRIPATTTNMFQYGTPEYFLVNILNPNLLIDAANNIKHGAIVISMDSDIKYNQKLTVFDIINPDMDHLGFLNIIGGLYEVGIQPKIEELFTKICWPVSRGTPMISPFVKWNHEKKYSLPVGKNQSKHKVFGRDGERWVTIRCSDSTFYKGHVIDGRNLFPATGYLSAVWEFLAELAGKYMHKMNICFENVKFHRASTFGAEGILKLYINIHRSGHFEIQDENDTSIVTGTVLELPESNLADLEDEADETIYESLNKNDIYKELRLRGYNYRGPFRAVNEITGSKSFIEWTGNWIVFIDNMLQISLTADDNRNLYVPTGIERLVIDAVGHTSYIDSLKDDDPIHVPVTMHKSSKIIRSKFIEIRGLYASAISRKKQIGQPILEAYKFIPNESSLSLKDAIRASVQIVIENKSLLNFKVLEVFDEHTCHSTPFSPEILSVLDDMPLIQPTLTILTDKDLDIQINGITIENKEFTSENGNLLFVGSNLLNRGQVLMEALNTLVEGGFLLTLEDTIDVIPENITVLIKYQIDTQQLLLIRKKITYKESSIIHIFGNNSEKWLSRIQNAMKVSKNIILYSQGEEYSGILGLVNCLRREPNGEKVTCVLIKDSAPPFEENNVFYKSQLSKCLAINVYQEGSWGTYRHMIINKMRNVENVHCFANTTIRGDLSSLKWMEGHLDQAHNENIVNVYYSSINFRDVMTATGKVPIDAITKDRLKQECIHGLEFSGRNSKRERVMGIITSGAIATMIESTAGFTWTVPDDWSLEDAAAIPVVYLTVIYALLERAKLKRGQSILIHSGTGGIGLAAINVALHFDCNIFVTVGTKEKRQFLNQHYPSIKDSHIGNSRDTSFKEMILLETNGRGVDIVLNSLAEEKLRASVQCLAKGGNFLEIGKYDISINNALSVELIAKGCVFQGVMLDKIKDSQKEEYSKLLIQGIKSGYVKPLPKTVFKMDQLEEAFRYMSTGKHIGKVMIQIREEEPEKMILPAKTMFPGIARYFSNPLGSYVIIGGLGGFGLELADWLIIRGARNIILSSRNGVTTGYQSMRIRIWKSYGVKIVVSLLDVTTLNGCFNLLKQANALAPIEGIFNLGVVLKDALLENQTVEDFKTSFGPKATATTNLDKVTRENYPNLKHFVVFSSVSCGKGNAGQTNYGMSNSVMERICEKRKNDGLSGLAIQWGAVGDVGLVAEMQKEATEIAIGGTLQQRMSSCLEMMDIFLRQNEPVVASMVIAQKSGLRSGDNMVEVVANIIGIRDLKTVSRHSTLADLGMDSMTAVEIKQVLERDYDIFLSPENMRNLTITKLIELNEQRENQQNPMDNDIMADFQKLLHNLYDEKTYNLPILEMPTENKSQSVKVFFFPGLDGASLAFKKLAASIKYQTACVQYNTNENCKDIHSIVDSIYDNVRNTISNNKQFHFVAHSFGCIVALETASRLEKEGYLGKIVLIDGSPAVMQKYFNVFNVETVEFENNLLCTITGLHSSQNVVLQLKEKLDTCDSFQERLNICKTFIPEDIPYSKEILIYMVYNMNNILKIIGSYAPSFKTITSKIVLYKPTTPMIKDYPADLNLSLIYKDNIEIKEFDGNHLTIIHNNLLSEELEQFFSV